MLKNAAEYNSGIIAYNDVVQNPEHQSRKKYSKEKTSLNDRSNALVNVSKELRKFEGTGLERNFWVGGGTWFRSVSSCIELKKRMDVNSNFVVKNDTNVFL